VRDSKEPQQCLVGPYSGDDALRRDGIQQHHLGPWLGSKTSHTSDLSSLFGGQAAPISTVLLGAGLVSFFLTMPTVDEGSSLGPH
jgi:hypothetical protein